MHIREDFLRCGYCEHPYFEEKVVFSVDKTILGLKTARQHNETISDDYKDKQIDYVCSRCGAKANI